MAKIKIQSTRLLQKIFACDKRILILQGGAGSSKTYSVLQSFIGRSWRAFMNNSRILATVAGISLPHLKKGAYRDFEDIMYYNNLYNEKYHNKTDHLYNLWGSKIEFWGLDKGDKAKGPRRDYLFMNEANLHKKKDFEQLARRTKKQIILDLNPSDNYSWVYDLADSGNPDVEVIISTYKDNPFLSEGERIEIERAIPVWQLPDGTTVEDRAIKYEDGAPRGWTQIRGDYNTWKIYGLGRRGTPKELIYESYQLFDWDDAPSVDEAERVYGIDFGFNNPATLIELRERDGNLYCKELIYKSGLLDIQFIKQMDIIMIEKATRRLAEDGWIIENNHEKSLNRLSNSLIERITDTEPYTTSSLWSVFSEMEPSADEDEEILNRLHKRIDREKNEYFYCDSAEPDKIEKLKQAGYNAKKSDKSVKDGIDHVKSKNLLIERSSVHIRKEIQQYRWKTDKDDNVLDEPIKLNDHTLDPIRYGSYTHTKTPDSVSSFVS